MIVESESEEMVQAFHQMEVSDEGNSSSSDLNMRESILDSVSQSDAFFKSQQVGEKDLTFSEKREIAHNLLDKNVPLFLQRYWQHIKSDDLPYFTPFRENYEVNFYLCEIQKNSSKSNKVKVKNRRYEALQKLIKDGSYFSDSEMKARNPFLYDQLIGQHLTEEERIAVYNEQTKGVDKFSGFLMNQMERNQENYLYNSMKDADDAVIEEEDDDDEEVEEESSDEETAKATKSVTEQEKSLLRAEFTNIMYESFLAGKDTDFDYSSVDSNVEYDSVHQRDIDEEEKYFDEEIPESID